MEVKHEPVEVEGRVYRGNQLVQSEKGEMETAQKKPSFFNPPLFLSRNYTYAIQTIFSTEELNPFIDKLMKAIKEKIGIQPKEKVYIIYFPFLTKFIFQ